MFSREYNEQQMTNREILETIYNALQERNYNAIDQMVGYLTSGDPSYITSTTMPDISSSRWIETIFWKRFSPAIWELRRSNAKTRTGCRR
mgnify:CR=1 FL=1